MMIIVKSVRVRSVRVR